MADIKLTARRKKEGRGLFLTSILIIHTIIAIMIIYRIIYFGIYISTLHEIIDTGWPDKFNIIFTAAFYFLVIITIPYLWKWSKIGVYGLILFVLIWIANLYFWLPGFLQLLFNVITKPISDFFQLIIFIFPFLLVPFCAALLYYFAIKSKWYLFS